MDDMKSKFAFIINLTLNPSPIESWLCTHLYIPYISPLWGLIKILFWFLQIFSFTEPVGVRHYVTLYIIPAPAGQYICRSIIFTLTPSPVGT